MVFPRLLLVVLIAIVLFDPQVALAQTQKQPTAIGSGGAAATVDLQGTRAAIRTLRMGGNAVDAAVAAAAVLGVTEPFSCGIGGGGFMVIRTAKGKVTTIDGREESPATMQPDSFWENGAALAFNEARYSGLSAGVPGTVATWQRALNRYGTWSLAEALRPGIRVARDGFTVDSTFASQTEPNIDWFNDIPSTAAIYLDPDGTARDPGATLQNPDLARTYRRLARNGADWFYNGRVADAMAEASQDPPKGADANHAWRPGLMTADDVADYRAIERAPTRIGYRGLEVWGMGPPSSGGSTVGEALNILEGYPDLSAADRVRALHLMLEASRFTFADRNAYLADPDFFDVPLAGLLSDSFAAERRALIDENKAATSPVAPGDPYDNQKGGGKGGKASATISHPRQSTTHLVVSDTKGNVVSYTFTIESTGGNAIVVPGYGFLMNNELTDFNFDSPTHPNRADGDKRPRSSMSPTIVTSDGSPLIAVGSPGGSTIPGTVLQVLLERLELGKSLPDAIATPRVVQRNAATSPAEPEFINSPEGQALLARGHAYVHPPPAEIGAVTGIEFLGGGRTLAAAEPVRRGGGSAAVVQP
jgi:gamma-glutamyltranspeptidase/glutathione hydrolase